MTVNVRIKNAQQVERFLRKRFPTAVIRAERRTVDKSATAARRDLVDRIARNTTAAKPSLNKRIVRVERSRQNRPVASIGIDRRSMPIPAFKPRVRKRSVAVFADIDVRPGRGVELIRKAFSPLGDNRKFRVFEREVIGGKRVGRLPITIASGPSAAQMYAALRDDFLPDNERKAADLLNAELRKETAKFR